jgi:hypothetical protein
MRAIEQAYCGLVVAGASIMPCSSSTVHTSYYDEHAQAHHCSACSATTDQSTRHTNENWNTTRTQVHNKFDKFPRESASSVANALGQN